MEREGVRFYGYKHWTLEDPPRCFNVGKGVKKRPKQASNRNHKWHSVVKRFGLRVEVCIGPIEHFDACSWEIKTIETMGTYSTNHRMMIQLISTAISQRVVREVLVKRTVDE